MSAEHDPGGETTYRYLRLAMVLVLVLLAAAVVKQVADDSVHCLHISISAYYFTPVRSAFVLALGALGTCLLIYRGNSPAEDVLLNFTGVAVGIVAIVPTGVDHAGAGCPLETNRPTDSEIAAMVANNGFAFLAAGVVALGLAVGLAAARKPHMLRQRLWYPEPAARAWSVAASLAVIVAIGWFLFARASFIKLGHDAGAVSTFVGIILVVLINAYDYNRHRGNNSGPFKKWANRYGLIAGLLIVSMAGVGLSRLIVGTSFRTWLFWMEASTLTVFAAFWIVQTIELWGVASRSETPNATGSPLVRAQGRPDGAHRPQK